MPTTRRTDSERVRRCDVIIGYLLCAVRERVSICSFPAEERWVNVLTERFEK